MKMHYITRKGEFGQETIIAVAGRETTAAEIIQSLKKGDFLKAYTFQDREIIHLKTEKIIVPVEMNWIVESDKRHQESLEREFDDRMENITGENALSIPPENFYPAPSAPVPPPNTDLPTDETDAQAIS